MSSQRMLITLDQKASGLTKGKHKSGERAAHEIFCIFVERELPARLESNACIATWQQLCLHYLQCSLITSLLGIVDLPCKPVKLFAQ